MFEIGLFFVCSFDITPIALANKVLVHLVFPRCEVGSRELFYRKSACHLSVYVELLLLLLIRSVQVVATAIGWFFVNARLDTTHAKAMGLDQDSNCSYTM